MRPYGIDSARQKGHKHAEYDISTRGYFLSARGKRSKRRNEHKRIYKKLERVNVNRNIVKEVSNDRQ
jgi:hypothetical protein